MIHIEIWSDVVCPFCYIGKRRLEKTLSNFAHRDAVQIEWKSFLLDPETVTSPETSITQHLADKKGWTLDYAREMNAYVTEMAAGEGLAYHFDKVCVANSINAHRLLQYAKRLQKGDAMKEALLSAYFIEGKNIDDVDTLVQLAAPLGIDAAETAQLLQDESTFRTQVFADVREANQLGLRGVPFFVFNRTYGISGAQAVEHFTAVLEKAYTESLSKETEAVSGDSCSTEDKC